MSLTIQIYVNRQQIKLIFSQTSLFFTWQRLVSSLSALFLTHKFSISSPAVSLCPVLKQLNGHLASGQGQPITLNNRKKKSQTWGSHSYFPKEIFCTFPRRNNSQRRTGKIETNYWHANSHINEQEPSEFFRSFRSADFNIINS